MIPETKCLVILVLLTCPFYGLHAQTLSLGPECGAGEVLDNGACRPIEEVVSPSGKIYWVDQGHPAAHDDNPGTKESPWRTITQSTYTGVLNPGDGVIIREGIYRESIRPRVGGRENAYITWAAYPGDKVIISGAEIVTTPWERQSDGSWRQRWEWAAQTIHGSSELIRDRRELFVVDGQVLRQVQSRSELGPGTFYVEGSDQHPMAVYLRMPGDTDPNFQLVEVGQRDRLFYSHGEGSHQCGSVQQGYYRLIGMTFTHGTSRRQRMVVCPGSEGSLVENVNALWNNGGGIKLVGVRHTLRGVVTNYNGTEGMGGTRCHECLVEYSESSYNNWKGNAGSGHGGGGKWTRTTSSIFRYNTFRGNEGAGIWLDIDNRYNEIYGNIVDSNLAQGIFIELRSSRNKVYNNVVTRTRFISPHWSGHGINISTSDSNLIAFNTLMLNESAGVRVHGDNRRHSAGNMIYNNLFVSNTAGIQDDRENLREVALLGSGSPTLSIEERWNILQSNRLDGNVYSYRPGPARSGYATFMFGPRNPNTASATYTNDLSEWRNAIGADGNGQVAQPNQALVIDVTDIETGWMLSSGSLAQGAAVRLPPAFEPISTDIFGNPRPSVGADVGAHQRTPVNLDSGLRRTQTIQLNKEWNLVSSYVVPDELLLDNIFLQDDSPVRIVENNSRQQLAHRLSGQNNHEWTGSHVYRIYSESDAPISISGKVLEPSSISISLDAAWQLIPYIYDHSRPIEEVLAPVLDLVVMVKNNAGEIFAPMHGINDIGMMRPGEGYEILLSEPAVLSF